MVTKTEDLSNPAEEIKEPSLPKGSYRLVAFDLDLTGRRLIDEIVHIAGYCPSSKFSQYVLPFRYLNDEARYRHLLRVVTVSRYRMLRSDKTGKILKTKSEISAVTDFVQWLESLQADNIILLTHEQRKTVPLFLLEVLKKYGLYDRFCKIVKGFGNTYQLAKLKCAETVKSFSLFSLCVVLLDKEEDLDSAADRSQITYKIVQHLCGIEEDEVRGLDNPSEAALAGMSEGVREIALTISETEEDLIMLKKLVERQDTLKPIFGAMVNTRIRFDRYRANNMRRLVVEANLTYDDLRTVWNENKSDGIRQLITEKVPKTTKMRREISDLIEILIAHFDPQYKPKFAPKQFNRLQPSKTSESENQAEEAVANETTRVADENDNVTADTKHDSFGLITPVCESSPLKENESDINVKVCANNEVSTQNTEQGADTELGISN